MANSLTRCVTVLLALSLVSVQAPAALLFPNHSLPTVSNATFTEQTLASALVTAKILISKSKRVSIGQLALADAKQGLVVFSIGEASGASVGSPPVSEEVVDWLALAASVDSQKYSLSREHAVRKMYQYFLRSYSPVVAAQFALAGALCAGPRLFQWTPEATLEGHAKKLIDSRDYTKETVGLAVVALAATTVVEKYPVGHMSVYRKELRKYILAPADVEPLLLWAASQPECEAYHASAVYRRLVADYSPRTAALLTVAALRNESLEKQEEKRHGAPTGLAALISLPMTLDRLRQSFDERLFWTAKVLYRMAQEKTGLKDDKAALFTITMAGESSGYYKGEAVKQYRPNFLKIVGTLFTVVIVGLGMARTLLFNAPDINNPPAQKMTTAA